MLGVAFLFVLKLSQSVRLSCDPFISLFLESSLALAHVLLHLR